MGKTLAKSNIHIRNSKQRLSNMTRNIESSSAIEGICVKRNAATGRFVERKNISSKSTRIIEVKRDSKTGRFVSDKV